MNVTMQSHCAVHMHHVPILLVHIHVSVTWAGLPQEMTVSTLMSAKNLMLARWISTVLMLQALSNVIARLVLQKLIQNVLTMMNVWMEVLALVKENVSTFQVHLHAHVRPDFFGMATPVQTSTNVNILFLSIRVQRTKRVLTQEDLSSVLAVPGLKLCWTNVLIRMNAKLQVHVR